VNKLRIIAILAVACLLNSLGFARVGEVEEELVHRYGPVQSRQAAVKSAQGRTYTYGEYIRFRSEDWGINALLINGRCEEVTYSKSGEWTETQFKHLLEINGGRSQWEEQKTTIPQLRREWKRRDKVMAVWSGGGFEVKSPVVEQTRDAVAKAAKEEASRLPKF
jgi:hypothetical protein